MTCTSSSARLLRRMSQESQRRVRTSCCSRHTIPTEGTSGSPKADARDQSGSAYAGASRVRWQGDVPPQKWMNFYTKVLSKFATQSGLKIGLNVEIAPEGGVSNQKVDEIKVALRELGLSDEISFD